MTTWTMHAAYDAEAKLWYSFHTDVPGLVTSGETIERLRERAGLILPELIELNAHEIDPGRRKGPHHLHLIAFHESTLPVAA